MIAMISSLKQHLTNFRKQKASKLFLKWGVALFWIAGIILLGWLIFRYHQTLQGYLETANYWFLLGFLVFYAISFGLGAILWAAIMSVFSGEISFLTHIKIFSITLASRRLPGTVWYIGGRAVYYQKLGIPLGITSLASAIELVCWVISGFIIGLFLLPSILNFPAWILFLLRLLALGGLLVFHPRSIQWIMKKGRRPLQKEIHYRDTIKWVLLSAGIWLAGGGMVIELINAFVRVGYENIPYILGAWSMAGTLGLLTTFLPSSFGVMEISLTTMVAVKYSLPLGVVISLLVRIIAFFLEYLLSFLFYLYGDRLKYLRKIFHPR